MDIEYIQKLQEIIKFHQHNDDGASTIAQYRYMIEREVAIVEFPEDGILIESELEWNVTQKNYSQFFDEEIVGHPEKFPCIGFRVYTQYNTSERDCQIWAFIYPKE